MFRSKTKKWTICLLWSALNKMMSYRQHFKLDFTDCCQSYLCTVFHWHFVGRLSSQTLLSLAIYSKSAAIVLKLWNEGSPHLFCALAVCHCIRRVSSQKWYTTVQSNIALIRDLLYISNYFSLSVHSGVLIMLVVLLLQCIYWYFFFRKLWNEGCPHLFCAQALAEYLVALYRPLALSTTIGKHRCFDVW